MKREEIEYLLKKNLTFKKSNPKKDLTDTCIYDDESIFISCKADNVNSATDLVKSVFYMRVDNPTFNAKELVDEGIFHARFFLNLNTPTRLLEITVSLKIKNMQNQTHSQMLKGE